MLTIKEAAEGIPRPQADRGHRGFEAPREPRGRTSSTGGLRDRGYEVFAVNPNARRGEGDKAYGNLTSIPGGVEAVVIGNEPRARGRDDARVCRPRHRAV
jgi:hypothetical protein